MAKRRADSVPLFYTPPESELDFDYRNGVIKGTAILDFAANVYTIANFPAAKPVASIIYLFNSAMGVGVRFSDPPATQPQVQVPAGYDEFESDFKAKAADPTIGSVDTSDIAPVDFATIVGHLNDPAYSETNNPDWRSTSLYVAGKIVFPKVQQKWTSDHYDQHGFEDISQSTCTARLPGTITRIWTWEPNNGSSTP